MADAQYFIENGVHRDVAAPERGLTHLPAVLFEAGAKPRLILVNLAQLHSPRSTVSRSDPRHNLAALEAAMASPAARGRIPPIEIQPLGVAAQPWAVPLAQVQIVT